MAAVPRRGRWRDYLFGERVYIVLSLTAKSALAWQVFAGTLGVLTPCSIRDHQPTHIQGLDERLVVNGAPRCD